MRTIMRASAGICVLLGSGCAAMAQAPDAATSVDISMIVDKVFMLALTGIAYLASTWIKGHLADKNAQDTLITGVENLTNSAINCEEGALKGHPLNVNVGSRVAAGALRHVLSTFPEEIARLGYTEPQLARMVVGYLPGVDGKIDDGMLSQIVSTATGKPPAMPSAADFGAVIAPMLKQVVEEAIESRYPKQPADVAAKTQPA